MCVYVCYMRVCIYKYIQLHVHRKSDLPLVDLTFPHISPAKNLWHQTGCKSRLSK